MRSEFRTELWVRVEPLDGVFSVITPLIYYSAVLGKEIIVPSGFMTDFASIPRIFKWLFEVNGKHRSAAVVHDWLCVAGKRLGIPQKLSDRIFLEAMEVLGVDWEERRIMYRAVRLYQSIAGLFK